MKYVGVHLAIKRIASYSCVPVYYNFTAEIETCLSQDEVSLFLKFDATNRPIEGTAVDALSH